jgi:hypothetical protein
MALQGTAAGHPDFEEKQTLSSFKQMFTLLQSVKLISQQMH